MSVTILRRPRRTRRWYGHGKGLSTLAAVWLTLLMVSPADGQILEMHRQQFVTKALEDSAENAKLEKKSPTGALLRSLAFPGWGQWYNEKKLKAIIAFSAETFLIGLALHLNHQANRDRRPEDFTDPGREITKGNFRNLVERERNFYLDRRNLTYWWLAGVKLLSMLDAYVDAYLHDFDAGPDLALRVGLLQRRSGMDYQEPAIGLTLRAVF